MTAKSPLRGRRPRRPAPVPALVLVSSLLLTASLALAAPGTAPDDPLWEEGFEAGFGPGWITEGLWSTERGDLVWRQDGVGRAVAGDEEWTDYVFRGSFYLDRERPGTAGVIVRAEHYRLGGGQYLLLASDLESGRVTLAHVSEGREEILDRGRFDFLQDLWYDFEVIVEGGRLRFFVDDFLVLETRGIFEPVRGKVGVQARGIVAFDDLSVHALAPVPETGPTRRETPLDKTPR